MAASPRLTGAGEYELFTVICDSARVKDETLCVKAAKAMMAHLKQAKLLPAGWAESSGGRKRVSLTLQMISLGDEFQALGLCSEDDTDPPFVRLAVEELARTS